MDVIKRNGLENKLNEADKALQEFRKGMPSAENERKLDYVLNSLKSEAGVALERLANKQTLQNDRIILADIAKNGLEGINNQYYESAPKSRADNLVDNFVLLHSL